MAEKRYQTVCVIQGGQELWAAKLSCTACQIDKTKVTIEDPTKCSSGLGSFWYHGDNPLELEGLKRFMEGYRHAMSDNKENWE